MYRSRKKNHGANCGKSKYLASICAALYLLFPSAASAAENFPNRPVEMIVPYPAGGSADLVTRLIADQMAKRWGSPVVVQNKPGAAGQIAWSILSKSKPDGYVIGLVSPTLIHLPAIKSSLPFDVVEDFDFITRVVEMPFVMTVSAKFPAQTITEVIEFARNNPGELNYGSFGVGSSPHILGAMLAHEADIQLTHIPLDGAPELIRMAIRGDIPAAFDLIVTQLPYIKSSQLVPLFVTSPKRNKILPDTPSAAEVGLTNIEFSGWFGYAAPRGVPSEIMRELNKSITAAVRTPEVQAKLQELAMEVKTESPEDFRKFVTSYKEKVQTVLHRKDGDELNLQ